MGLDVNGNDNQPEWGYCHTEGCKEGAFPIWKSGAYPDDPDLLLCPKHLGELIGSLEADAAALREAIEGILEDDSAYVSLDDQRRRWSERMKAAEAALSQGAGAKLLDEIASSHKANREAAVEIARLREAMRQAARMFTITGARKIIEQTIGAEP